MTLYRNSLPQLGNALFVTDGGLETALIFNEGIELPDFAAFDLFRRPGRRGGTAALLRGIRAHRHAIPRRHGAGERNLACERRLGPQARLPARAAR